jgi:hypothetical protein
MSAKRCSIPSERVFSISFISRDVTGGNLGIFSFGGGGGMTAELVEDKEEEEPFSADICGGLNIWIENLKK